MTHAVGVWHGRTRIRIPLLLLPSPLPCETGLQFAARRIPPQERQPRVLSPDPAVAQASPLVWPHYLDGLRATTDHTTIPAAIISLARRLWALLSANLAIHRRATHGSRNAQAQGRDRRTGGARQGPDARRDTHALSASINRSPPHL